MKLLIIALTTLLCCTGYSNDSTCSIMNIGDFVRLEDTVTVRGQLVLNDMFSKNETEDLLNEELRSVRYVVKAKTPVALQQLSRTTDDLACTVSMITLILDEKARAVAARYLGKEISVAGTIRWSGSSTEGVANAVLMEISNLSVVK